jgi:hypothetical protein
MYTCIRFYIQRDMFPLPPVLGEESQVLRVKNQCIRVRLMYVNVRKHPRNCGPAIEDMESRVQGLKVHASESGQMYCTVCTAPCNLWPGH